MKQSYLNMEIENKFELQLAFHDNDIRLLFKSCKLTHLYGAWEVAANMARIKLTEKNSTARH